MSETSDDTIARASTVVDAAPDQVWQALTDPAIVKQYFFGTTVTSDWSVGSPITYSGEWDGKAYEDKGEVLEVEEPRRLVTSFFSPSSGKADAPENYQKVTYLIEETDGGTRVSVEQDNNADAEAAAHSSGNWQMILDGLAGVVGRR